MTAVPAAAITAAQQADREFGRKNGGVWLAVGHLRLASILEAAAPHLDAARMQLAIDTLTIRPGDRLVIRASGVLSQEQGEKLLDRARAALLPGRDVPILIADDTAAFRVEPDAELTAARQRIAELEQLATDLIAAFGKSDAGWRARLSGTVLDRHRATLAGQP